MSPKNPHEILGVTPSASTEEIKVAYRNLVKRYHPDKYPTYLQKAWATKKTQEINEAYAILRDPLRRNQCDKSQATSDPVPAARRARSAQRNRPQSSTAQSDAPGRWFVWFSCGTWLAVSTIFFFFFVKAYFSDNLLSYIVAAVISFYFGALATVMISLVPRSAWERMKEFDQKLSSAPSYPWRDLAIRLALLAAVVVPMLYLSYPPDTNSFLSYFFCSTSSFLA